MTLALHAFLTCSHTCPAVWFFPVGDRETSAPFCGAFGQEPAALFTPSAVKVVGKEAFSCCACDLQDKTQPQFPCRYRIKKENSMLIFLCIFRLCPSSQGSVFRKRDGLGIVWVSFGFLVNGPRLPAAWKEIFTEVFSVASGLPDTPVELEMGIKTVHIWVLMYSVCILIPVAAFDRGLGPGFCGGGYYKAIDAHCEHFEV